MKLYRNNYYNEELVIDGFSWHESAADAKLSATEYIKNNGKQKVKVETNKIQVGPGKEGILRLLNLYTTPSSWNKSLDSRPVLWEN